MTGAISTTVLVFGVVVVVSLVFTFLGGNIVMLVCVSVSSMALTCVLIMTPIFVYMTIMVMHVVLFAAGDFEVIMRKLKTLCRKLHRFGIEACVVSHFRGNYRVHFGSGVRLLDYRDFSSVRECEQFLLGLFR